METHADVTGCRWVQTDPDLVCSHALTMNDQLLCDANKNGHLLTRHALKQQVFMVGSGVAEGLLCE